MSEKKMNGAEAVVAFLQEKGVDPIFGYPGGPVLVLYEAFYNARFPHLLTRHEQGAVHAAEGYAKSTGRPGVVVATSGPGATNLVTGIADAYLDSVPILAITGNVALPYIGTDAFQEADITGITMPIMKYNYLVTRIEDLLPILEEAYNLTTDGRPGPVGVNIPKDLLAATLPESFEEAMVRARVGRTQRHRPPRKHSEGAVEPVLDALRKAHRPLLLVGGGVTASPGATEELARFVDRTGLPVSSTLMGKGCVPENRPEALGMCGMHGLPQSNIALGRCDLLLAVGCRFSDRITGDPRQFNAANATAKKRFIIHVDIDPAEIGKNIKTDIEIEDDAAVFFRTLLARLEALGPAFAPDWSEWKAELRGIHDKYERLKAKQRDESAHRLIPQTVIRRVAEAEAALGRHPVVVTDVGQHQMFAAQHYPVSDPRSFLTSGGLGTMGFGLPAAIGGAVAHKDRDTVLFVGDGGLQMTIQELGTLQCLNLPVKIFVMDNAALGMVRQWQELFFHGHYSHSILCNNPDFPMVARAYGIPGGRADSPESFERELEKALAEPGPYLVHVILEGNENVYPIVPPGKQPHDMIIPGLHDEPAPKG